MRFAACLNTIGNFWRSFFGTSNNVLPKWAARSPFCQALVVPNLRGTISFGNSESFSSGHQLTYLTFKVWPRVLSQPFTNLFISWCKTLCQVVGGAGKVCPVHSDLAATGNLLMKGPRNFLDISLSRVCVQGDYSACDEPPVDFKT